MDYYSEEDVFKALDIIKDLVKENEKLKDENVIYKRFLAAQCMHSETGVVSFVGNGYEPEDIDEMLKRVHLNVHYVYNAFWCTPDGQRGERQESTCHISFANFDPHKIWTVRDKEEILEKFEEYRNKEND